MEVFTRMLSIEEILAQEKSVPITDSDILRASRNRGDSFHSFNSLDGSLLAIREFRLKVSKTILSSRENIFDVDKEIQGLDPQ